MTYRLLRQDCHSHSWSILTVEGIAVHELSLGVPMEAPEGVVQVTLSALGEQPSDFLDNPCPIVSDAMKQVIDGTGVDSLQWFPAELTVDATRRIHRSFWAMNVIGKLACVDRLRTDAEELADGLQLDLSAFVVDSARAYDLSIFRLAEDPRVILVSERIQRALSMAGLRGILLQEPLSYNRGLPAESTA